MTSILQDILGGSSSTSVSTPINMNPLTGTLAPGLGSYMSGLLSQGAPQYNGPLSVSTTGNQNTLMSQLMGQVAPNNGLNTYTNNVFSGAYMPGGALGNPYLSQNIAASITPIQESLSQTLSQALPEQFTAAGQNVQGTGSSAFANAAAIAQQGAANAEAQVATSLGSNAYNQGISQMNTAAQVAPQEVQSTINSLQAELLPTLLQEQGITNGLQAFQENIGALTSFLQTMTGAESPVVANQTVSSGSSSSGLLPGIGSLFRGSSQSPGGSQS